MPALDPIVSLTVAIAEAPGSYAFLLGSGVSRDAGVLTGEEVSQKLARAAYRVQHATSTDPDEATLTAWLVDEDGQRIGYSDLLALIAPDQAGRRNYLEGLFEDASPGPAHQRLAELARRGLITTFITTNFDRLLENALQAVGIEPTVVSSARGLHEVQRREHARCYVLKPHGDYLQETIRNTPGELSELEAPIAQELQEIVDRYGLVVLGYSGSDEAIADTVRRRRSRSGLYWVARTPPTGPAQVLIEQTGGRAIIRAGAAEFLLDLDLCLAAYEQQPSGLTAPAVNAAVTELCRRGDRVDLWEFLRDERTELGRRL